jgi:hypothetical protein
MPGKFGSSGTRACSIDEALQGLDLSTMEKAIKDFPFFPQLPTELRIQIWETTFVPRRIMLRSHSDRPHLDPSIGALLLVNNEAHQVLVENYTLSFHEHGLTGIYINFSIDTLFLNSSNKALRLLLKQYPKTMARIQWLDLRPCAHQLRNTNLSSMTSLQLLTVRWHLGQNSSTTWTCTALRTWCGRHSQPEKCLGSKRSIYFSENCPPYVRYFLQIKKLQTNILWEFCSRPRCDLNWEIFRSPKAISDRLGEIRDGYESRMEIDIPWETECSRYGMVRIRAGVKRAWSYAVTWFVPVCNASSIQPSCISRQVDRRANNIYWDLQPKHMLTWCYFSKYSQLREVCHASKAGDNSSGDIRSAVCRSKPRWRSI